MAFFRRSKGSQTEQEKKQYRKQLKKFYLQELLGDYTQMKKYMLIIMIISGTGELGKAILLPDNHKSTSTTLEQKLVLYLSFVLGAILYASAFLKRLERASSKYIVIRCVMLSLANLSIFVYLIARCLYYFGNTDFGNDNENLMSGIAFFSTGAYLPLVLDILNPIWYIKIVIPLGYYIGLLVGAYSIEGDFQIATWIRTGIAIVNILIVTAFKDHFRWKLFEKRSKDEEINKTHEQILHHVPSPIAVFDVEGQIVYRNYAFKKLSKDSFETFAKKIVKPKKRKENKDIDDSDINIETRIPPMAKVNSKNKETKPLQNNIDDKNIEDLNDLLQRACKSFVESDLDKTTHFVFDAKFVDNKEKDNKTEEKKYTSFEVALSFMSEYRRIILILRDTTQQAKILALENNNSYKDRLLASVSHELRTPLNGNLSLVDAAICSHEVPDHVKEELLVPAYRSGKLLLHLINDILDFSQITAKKLRLAFDQLPLRETIQSCYQLVELQAKRKGIDLRFSLDEKLSVFSTDHDRVKQIILNLLNNAIKFTFSGSVTLEAKLLSSSCVRVIVTDTGIGIKQENVSKLFKEFTRIDNPEHEKINSKGVGLGLTIAFKLAKRLGPKNKQTGIKVTSEFGKGSSFSFVIVDQASAQPDLDLPDEDSSFEVLLESTGRKDVKGYLWTSDYLCLTSLQTNENAQVGGKVTKYATPTAKNKKKAILSPLTVPSAAPLTDAYSGEPFSPLTEGATEYLPMLTPKRKKRILIVDDEPFNILAMESFAKGLNIQAEAAFNGKEAIEKAVRLYQGTSSSDFYDLIFMDCQMPIMDGYEATKLLVEMMQKKEIPEAPIFACTAFNAKEAIDNCYKVGMKDVLKKPLSKAKLEEILRIYLH